MTSSAQTLELPPRISLSKRTLVNLTIIVALLVLQIIAWQETEFSLSALVSGWDGMADFISEAIPPDLNWQKIVVPGLEATLVTLSIGFLGTTLSIPFALLFAVIGARTTTPNVVIYQATRSLMSSLRSIPEVVFALIFVTAVGLGPFPGVLALVFHNAGVMGKLWSEAIEEVDAGPLDALRVSGANKTQVVGNAVWPAVTPQFLGLLLYRFDVNVRASLVLGLVGAGGIGFLINQSIQLFRFDEMLTYILMVLILIIAVDLLSAFARKRLN